MGWERKGKKKRNDTEFLEKYGEDEKKVLRLIFEKNKASVDDIVMIAGLGASKTASILLQLEFEGVIRGLPGKLYELRR
jgi:DNA processing protein